MMSRSLLSKTTASVVVIITTLFNIQSCYALNKRLYGINYSLRIGADWTSGSARCKTYGQVRNDFIGIKAQITDNVRVFTMSECDTAERALRAVADVGMKVWLGIWVGPNNGFFNEERTKLIELLNNTNYDFNNVLGIHVSSEAVYRGDITVDDALLLQADIRDVMNTFGWLETPVTIAEIIDTNIADSRLNIVDPNVITFNQFPFWETTTNIDNAYQYMKDRVALIEAEADGRQIIVLETGWADAGSNVDANIADPLRMAKWLRDFYCLSEEQGWQYFWFDAYDSDWQRLNANMPGDVEGHFGIYDPYGFMKTELDQLYIDCSVPPTPIADFVLNPFPNATAPSTMSPTIAPVTATPTMTPETPTTMLPTVSPVTMSPTKSNDSADTAAPTTSPVTMSPTKSKDSADTAAPTMSPTTQAPASSGDTPTAGPTTLAPFIAPTTMSPVSPSGPECQANSVCAGLGLTGLCCPTIDDVFLTCCGGEIEETCALNPQCDDLGLTGSCCPAAGNIYLDCCTTVPDACLDENNPDCDLESAENYLRIQQESAATITKEGRNMIMTMIVSVSMVLCLVFL